MITNQKNCICYLFSFLIIPCILLRLLPDYYSDYSDYDQSSTVICRGQLLDSENSLPPERKLFELLAWAWATKLTVQILALVANKPLTWRSMSWRILSFWSLCMGSWGAHAGLGSPQAPQSCMGSSRAPARAPMSSSCTGSHRLLMSHAWAPQEFMHELLG